MDRENGGGETELQTDAVVWGDEKGGEVGKVLKIPCDVPK